MRYLKNMAHFSDKVHNLNLYKRAFIHKSYCKRPAIENEQNGVIIAERPDNCMTLKQNQTNDSNF